MFSDPEYALLTEAGKLSPRTPVVTTLHPVQIVASLPRLAHDFRLSHIVTPNEREITVLASLARKRTKKK